MSFFKLPDDILVNQLCDKCHKYLSVKPVKLNFNKILCGRCESNGEFVPSIYNSFADNLLFKCINNFDGCNKVLSCDQVIDHEKVCVVHEYSCPGCPTSAPKIPSYMFPYHMNKMHKKSCLTSNSFTVELIDSEISMFFYQQSNYLFFIRHQFVEEEMSMVLDFFYVGAGGSKIFLKCELKFGDNVYASRIYECFHVDNMFSHVAANKIRICENYKILGVIKIKLDFELPRMFENMLCSKVPVYRIKKGAIYEAFLYSVWLCRSGSCPISKRKIPGNDRIEIRIDSSTTKNINISTCFHCVLCTNFESFNSMRLTVFKGKHYLICKICLLLVSPLFEFKTIIPKFYLKYPPAYKCRIHTLRRKRTLLKRCGCLMPDRYSCIEELTSEIRCCIQNCTSSFKLFSQLKKHFKNCHSQDLLLSSDEIFNNPMTLRNKYYIFHWDKIILVTLEQIENVEYSFFINAEICDKEYEGTYHVLCGLYSSKDELIEILFKSKLIIDFGVVRYMTFIKFEFY